MASPGQLDIDRASAEIDATTLTVELTSKARADETQAVEAAHADRQMAAAFRAFEK